MLNTSGSGEKACRNVKPSDKGFFYNQNYKTAISDKITCWEGEQFPVKKLIQQHHYCR